MPTWTNVTHADGTDNPGGISLAVDAIKYIAHEDLDATVAVPELPASPSTDAQYVTITEDFTPAATKFFHTLYCTPEKGMIESEAVGETDGKSYKHSFSFFVPGGSDIAEAFGRKILNTRSYFVITELDGTIRLMGTKKFPAFIEEVKNQSGQKVADLRGSMFKIYCYGTTPNAPKFTGDAPLS